MDRRTFVSAAALPLVPAIAAPTPPHLRPNFQRSWFAMGKSCRPALDAVLACIAQRGNIPADHMDWQFVAAEYRPELEGVYGAIVASHEPGVTNERLAGNGFADMVRRAQGYERSVLQPAGLVLVAHDEMRGGRLVRVWSAA